MRANDQDLSIRLRECKRQARALLDTGNNRLWLILSVGLWLATAGLIYMLGGSLVYAADDSVFTEQPSTLATVMAIASYAVMLLLAFFILLPMGGGVANVAKRIYEKKPIGGKDLFFAFGSAKQYGICLKTGLYAFAWPIMIALAVVLTSLVAGSLLYENMIASGAIVVLANLIWIGMLLLGPALGFLVLFICKSAFVGGVLLARGERFWQMRRRMCRLCKGRGAAMLGYRMSFAGWAVLAVATVLVSAVVDTIPYLLLCNQFVCDALICENKTNEN